MSYTKPVAQRMIMSLAPVLLVWFVALILSRPTDHYDLIILLLLLGIPSIQFIVIGLAYFYIITNMPSRRSNYLRYLAYIGAVLVAEVVSLYLIGVSNEQSMFGDLGLTIGFYWLLLIVAPFIAWPITIYALGDPKKRKKSKKRDVIDSTNFMR